MATQASNEFTNWREKAPQYGITQPLRFILINTETQRLTLIDSNHQELASFPVSTSINGTGNEINSGNTPLGLHGIVERYGLAQPSGCIFSSRRLQPERWRGEHCETDLITSRILRLTGLEPKINGNTYSRYIYIHGTPHEELIGSAVSGGCIRMNNADVIELYDLCSEHELLCLIH